MRKLRALVSTWLVLDFFGDARRSGGSGSTLTTTIFTQSFLALVFAAIGYPDTPPVPFAAANLCLSSLLVAIGALGDHDGWSRRRADQALLGTSPCSRATVVLARSGHAAFYVCLVTIGMALPPGILLGIWCHDPLQTLGYVLLACACSGLSTAALAVAMRLLARGCGPARAALLAGSLKALLLGGGVAMFALGLQNLQRTADDLPIGRIGAELLPPYHAARLLAHPGETWRLLTFAGAAVVLLLLALAAGDPGAERSERRSGPGLATRLLRRISGNGARLGVAEFVATSIWRSPGFRARVLPLLGLPAGMVFLALRGDSAGNGFVFLCLLLQLPAIYLPFLVAFLPRADQSDAGWIFDQSPHLSRELVLDATWRALITHVLLPVHALALGLGMAFTGNRADAVAASLFSFGLAVLAARPLLRPLACVPFTQSRDADAATDLGGLFTFAVLLGGLGTGFGAGLVGWQRWAAAGAVLALCVRQLAARPTGTTAGFAAQATVEQPAAPTDPAEAPEAERDPEPPDTRAAHSLRRELRAIVALYGATSVLPLLLGWMFAR